MTRQQRRAAMRMKRRIAETDDVIIYHDRAGLLRIVAALVEVDPTISGATIVSPTCEMTYLSAENLRRGRRT